MADPLSIAASIAGVIGLADVVFTRTMRYVKAAKNADDDVLKLSREVLVLSGALASLSKLAGELDTAGLQNKPIDDLRMHHIQACHTTLDQIARGLKKLEGNALKRKVIWPFTSERTQESLREVSRHKETINLALTADSMETLLRILSKQEEMHVKTEEILEEVKRTGQIVNRIHQDQERRYVLDFFLKYNPQQNYETSLLLRHPRTGIWLTLLPVFGTWLSNPDSFLWLSGIPGAGKTVLAGTIIEETLKTKSETVATMFFFCDYKDIRTQSPENILCVLASQLAIQHEDAYSLLERYHQKLHPARGLRQNPTVVDLQRLLEDMMKSFDHVYLVVDGLDECGVSTCNVIDALLDIIDASDNISAAFLSRDEDHIRNRLEERFDHVEISAHTEDIMEYVTSEIEKRMGDKRLRFNDLSLKGEILDRLVDGANGMFRWVALQLDSLEYCLSDKDCRRALDRLPPGLDESYARILQQVPKGKEHLVQKMLNFIAYAEPKLHIHNLREALSVRDTVTADQAWDAHSIIREDSIPKLCKSLVRKSNDGDHYEFAHFTVQEFLEGQTKFMADLEPFRVSKSICNRLLAIRCLNYVQFKDFDHWPTNYADEVDYMDRRNEEHPFYMYAAIYWPKYARNEWTDQSLIDSALRLFSPKKTGILISWALQLLDDVVPSVEIPEDRNVAIERLAPRLMHRTFTPLHLAAALSLPVICSDLLEDGADIHQKSGFGTPLQCAAQGLLLAFSETKMQIILDLHRDPPELYEFESYYYISTDRKCYMTDTIKLLLDAGADHNLPCSSPFPGQSLTTVALRAARSCLTGILSASIALLESGNEPDEEALCVFDEFAGVLEVFGCRDIDLEVFVASLSPMIGKSTIHFELCQRAWLLAIRLGEDFTSDTTIVDSRISLAEDSLVTILFTSIKDADLQTLVSVSRDPRIDLNSVTNPTNECSPLEEAARVLWRVNNAYAGDYRSVFKTLFDAGCDVSTPDSYGRLPIHMLAGECQYVHKEIYSGVREVISEFILRGTGCTVIDGEGQNALHLGRSAPVFIEAFLDLETEANVTAALETQDRKGYTPISIALAKGQEESALLLLQRAKCRPDALRGPCPILHLCVTMNRQRAFDILVGADFQSQVVGTNQAAILHHITYRMSVDFLGRLMALYPKACTFRAGERIPLDVYLSSCLCSPRSTLDTEILEIMAKAASEELTTEEKKSVWENLMSSIQNAREGGEQNADPREKEIVLDHVTSQPDLLSFKRSYEEVTKVPAVLPLLAPLGCDLRTLDDLWPISTATLTRFLAGTSKTLWKSLRKNKMVVRLLKAAITAENTELVTFLLARRVSVHQRTDRLSALELACSTPATEDSSKTIFTQLLNHAYPSRLNETNPCDDEQKGLVHYLVGQSKEWQVRELLKRGADPNLRTSDCHSKPALVYHIDEGSVDTAQVLLEEGANPNLADSYDCDAALSSACSGLTTILTGLMASTAWNIDWEKTIDWSITVRGQDRTLCGVNALHLAAFYSETDSLSFYVDNGLLTDLNATSMELFTPIHMAAMKGSISSIVFLCGRGADINAKAADGSLPLHLAVQNKRLKAVKYLVEHGSTMTTDNCGMSPIAYAREVGNRSIVDFLGNHATVLTDASLRNTKEVAKKFGDALLREDMDTCEELLRQGYCLDNELPGLGGQTPLVWATKELKSGVIEWLLARNADTTRRVGTEQMYISPLHLMVVRPQLNGILPVMLDKCQRDGGSILHEKESMVCRVIEKNSNTVLRLLFDHVEKLEDPQIDDTGTLRHSTYFAANQRTNRGQTALQLAAIKGNVRAATLLLKNGADVDAVDDNGITALHYANCSRPHGHTLVAEILLQEGAATEYRDTNGNTPLMIASHQGNIEVARLLINAGADLEAPNFAYETPLHGAASGVDGPSKVAQKEVFATLLQLGLDPHQLNTGFMSPIHYGIRRSSFTSLLLNSDIRLDESVPFPWHGSYNMVPMAWLTNQYGLYLRKLGLERMRKLALLEPSSAWAPLCIYASMGQVITVTNLLDLGAPLDFEGCPSGSALMAASSAGRLETVRILVRHGASISYHGPNGFRSAINSARRNKKIVDWLLAGRFTDQKKITNSAAPGPSPDEVETRRWSGPVTAEMIISGSSQRGADESAEQYWVRLMAIRRDWRGKVVPENSKARTSRPVRLIPEEPVHICPGDYGTSEEQ